MATGKPMNIYSQWIATILAEITEKLTYLSVFTPQVLEEIYNEEGDKSNLLDIEMIRKLTDQMRLEELYQRNIVNLNENSHIGIDSDDVQEIADQLEANTRDLCRSMQTIPNIVQVLRSFQDNRPANPMKLIHIFAELREVMLKRLESTVEEEKSVKELFEKCIQQQKEDSEKRLELEKQLALLRNEREKKYNKGLEIITHLKADSHNSLDQTNVQLNFLYENNKINELEHRKLFQQFSQELSTKQKQSEESASISLRQAKEELEAWKPKKKILERDLKTLIANYDKQMLEKDKEIQSVRHQIHDAEEQVDQLSERMKVVDDENLRIQQEQAIHLIKLSDKAFNNKTQNFAATALQSYWRGILQREEYVKVKKKRKQQKKKRKKQ